MTLNRISSYPRSLPQQQRNSIASFGLQNTSGLLIDILFHSTPTRSLLEYCCNERRAAPPTTLNLLESVQSKTVQLIINSVLFAKIPSLAHGRAVENLCLWYRTFYRLCWYLLVSRTIEILELLQLDGTKTIRCSSSEGQDFSGRVYFHLAKSS